MGFKLATFSMDPRTLKRIEKLLEWKKQDNKSRLICDLIDTEYRRQLQLREEGEEDAQSPPVPE